MIHKTLHFTFLPQKNYKKIEKQKRDDFREPYNLKKKKKSNLLQTIQIKATFRHPQKTLKKMEKKNSTKNN